MCGGFSALLGEHNLAAIEGLEFALEELVGLFETGDAGQGHGELLLQLLVGRGWGRLGRGHGDLARERDVVGLRGEHAKEQLAELARADLIHELLGHGVGILLGSISLALDPEGEPIPQADEVPPDRVSRGGHGQIAPLPHESVQRVGRDPLHGSAGGLLDAQDHETLALPVGAVEVLARELDESRRNRRG